MSTKNLRRLFDLTSGRQNILPSNFQGFQRVPRLMFWHCFQRFSDRGGPPELGAPENVWFGKRKFCVWQCFVTPWPTPLSCTYSHSKTQFRLNTTLYQHFLCLTENATSQGPSCALRTMGLTETEGRRAVCNRNSKKVGLQ